jgi:hypothetical protein
MKMDHTRRNDGWPINGTSGTGRKTRKVVSEFNITEMVINMRGDGRITKGQDKAPTGCTRARIS